MSEHRPKSVKQNLFMSAADRAALEQLASLVVSAGERPNISLAVRVAVREALDRRTTSSGRPDIRRGGSQ